MGSKPVNESYSEQEAARRRDAIVKRMISTPPQPHKESKIGKKNQTRKKAERKARPKSR